MNRPREQTFHRAAEQNNWNSLVFEGPPESGRLKEEAEGFREEAETLRRPVGAWAGAQASGISEEGKVWGGSSSQGKLPRQGRAKKELGTAIGVGFPACPLKIGWL